MKKAIIILLTGFVLFASTYAYADDPIKKLGRGCANVITCPLEIFYRMGEANNEKGIYASFTWGILNGIYRTVVRAVVGVYEIATFPIPLPYEYKPIIDDPEFFWEDTKY